MKIKTSELIGPALDWAVEFIKGNCKAEPHANYWLEKWVDPERRYLCESASTNWSQGGPIIEREKITVRHVDLDSNGAYWCGQLDTRIAELPWFFETKGPTPLIAAMRCYVASELGDEVDVPDELLE